MNLSKNIVIIEFYAHESYLRSLLEIFRNDDVTLMVSEYFHEKFIRDPEYYSKVKIIVKKDTQSPQSFFKNNRKIIQMADILFLNTFCREYTYIEEYLNRKNVILTLHNLNDFFGNYNLTYGKYLSCTIEEKSKNALFLFGRYLIHCLKGGVSIIREAKYKYKAVKLASIFCVYHQNMAGKITKAYPKIQQIILPFKLPDKHIPPPSLEPCPLGLAMIGNVDPTRKDYSGVIDALEKAELQGPVKLSILGRCEKREFAKLLHSKINGLKNKNLEVCFEDPIERIPDDGIKARMRNIHYLVAATKIEIKVRLSLERYGETKATGCDFDALSFNRIVLNNDKYEPVNYLSDFTLSYSDYDHFVELINSSFCNNFIKKQYDRIENICVDSLKKSFRKEVFKKVKI